MAPATSPSVMDNPSPRFSDFGDEIVVTRTIENHYAHLLDRLVESLGKLGEVIGGGGVHVDGPATSRTHGDFLHVEAGAGIEHRAALTERDDGESAVPTESGKARAIDGIDRHVHQRGATVADFFAVVEHRSFVFFAFADNDHAVHRDGP
jgi:hypothetical protein